MEAFLSNILSFPTLVYTGLLAIMAIYWLFAIAGLLDLDMLDLDIDVDADADVPGFAGLMVTLGLTGVPLTVVLSIMFLSSWIICYLVVRFFFFWGDDSLINFFIGSGVIAVAFAASIPITAKLIKPLRPLFRALNNPDTKKIFIGRTCRIRSTRVDASFGEANLTIDGADLIIKVRNDSNYEFKKGEEALVVDKFDDNNTYWIEPIK